MNEIVSPFVARGDAVHDVIPENALGLVRRSDVTIRASEEARPEFHATVGTVHVCCLYVSYSANENLAREFVDENLGG